MRSKNTIFIIFANNYRYSLFETERFKFHRSKANQHIKMQFNATPSHQRLQIRFYLSFCLFQEDLGEPF